MAYEPTEWKSGDIITAEKMNKIESGIGFYPIQGVVSASGKLCFIDASYNEIMTAFSNGKIPIIIATSETEPFPDKAPKYIYYICEIGNYSNNTYRCYVTDRNTCFQSTDPDAKLILQS